MIDAPLLVYVVARNNDAILVFDRTADGDVPPKRVLSGTNTALDQPGSLVLVR